MDKKPTLADLAECVVLMERRQTSMAVTIDTLCQALACAIAPNHAADLRRIADDILAMPADTSLGDAELVEHGRGVARGVLLDMASAIDRGHDAMAKMAEGSRRPQ